MAEVKIELPDRTYTIHIGPGLLDHVGRHVRSVAPHDQAAMIADDKVASTHATRAEESLVSAGYCVIHAFIASGEEQKNLDTVRWLYDVLCEGNHERWSPVVAVGGGVTGDAAGFVAATYLRGVPFIQCPTTLLAMVDASVGGKVGVNIPQGKNLVGAFHQPEAVLIDTDTLKTLPAREFRCGLAECVKHAMIRDPGLMDWIEANLDALLQRDAETLVELIRRNVAIKADVVMEDERELGVRAHLNFGHTFGHAVEAVYHYSSSQGFRHGEAVALGMVAATHVATMLGWVGSDVLDRLVRLLTRIGLPVVADNQFCPRRELMAAMYLDKKVRDSRITLVLPKAIGRVEQTADVPPEQIEQAWDAVMKPGPAPPSRR